MKRSLGSESVVLALGASLAILVAAASCGSPPKMPGGPPPEYEDPPRPSWMSDAGSAPAAPAVRPPAPPS